MTEINGKDIRETAMNTYQGSPIMTIFSEQQKWISKIKRLKEKYPDEVTITAENDDGSIVAECPSSWMKFSPPRKMTEEQKQAAGERMRAMHQNRNVE